MLEHEIPPPEPIRPGVVERFEGIYEVDPALMQAFPQQTMPAWDTLRIVRSRHDFLEWMHGHFAPRRWSGDRGEPQESGLDKPDQVKKEQR